LQVQTLEDIPSAPPGDLNAVTLNLTSGLISWTPPPPQHRNGVLLQYSIKIETNKENTVIFLPLG
jgi:roundabout axon guidance receptor 2